MKVLITGGAGFVGRHFTKRLVDRGHAVTVVDSLISESAKAPDVWPAHLKCDFCFIDEDCRQFFTKNEDSWDLVIHLAAIVGGRAHMESNPIAVAEDLSIDAALFKWAVLHKDRIGHVIYFSSSAAYPVEYQTSGRSEKLHETMIDFEKSIGLPDLTYGWSKLTGEYLARTAAKQCGLKIACYRPFSGYGEDQDECYPFIGILRRVLRRENPVTIWSNSVRDFIYIEDVVTWVLDTYPTITDGSALNLGSGKGVSFSELAKLMMRVTGYDTEVVVQNDKPQGVYYRVSATAPPYPLVSLEEGIAKALPLNIP
jgi:nucleoside-diphosphate-sugar epimerase